ncbi:DUF2063 domain-containing protein [Thalassotalea sp. M1531]|uniref:DUF2063 domain-containing protein n=1 Tax=Thalassotalea algicola TaxID=2716224 RepID=A0A7Y0Q6Y1_9GAMM|nr:putative DNA-binding domain-containing protein [Thalassotalea algicola]NMP31292.1 DUF2063 domain-containing protein [Thalassotalea algicola]
MLKQYQSSLLSQILQSRQDFKASDHEQTGIAIYRNNYLASVKRSLANSFPAIKLLLQDNFDVAASHFTEKVLRTNADWAEIGEQFPHYLAQEAALRQLPYLSDLAVMEMALFSAERASDNISSLASLALLEHHAIDTLSPIFAPGFTIISSNYPLLEIRTHIINNDDEALNVLLTELTDKKDKVYHFAVYRIDLQSHSLLLPEELVAYYQQLLSHDTLDDGLSAIQTPTADLSDWLKHAIEHHILLGIATVS